MIKASIYKPITMLMVILTDVEALEDLIMAAINAAVKKKDEAQQASISDITGGMKIPGLM